MNKYINREAVLNLIEHNDKVCHYADERYENVVCATTQTICKVVAEMPSSDVQPVNQWISCKDKMPDDGVNVLIYAGNRMISLAWYDKDMGYFYICDSDYKYNSLDVTHWQPLPEPPKDGDAE